jgi:hypothetical protein
MSLVVHIALFLCIAAAIVVISAFYADAEDRAAFRSVPKRAFQFVFGCTLLAVVLIVCEHVFGSVR